MEEEIDLSKYLEILIRRWWIVIGMALVCALVAGAVVLPRPAKYQARALVAMMKSASQVSFGTAITTLSEGDAKIQVDRLQRQASFVELISSPTIAKAVLQSLGDKLPESNRNVRGLLRMVKGSLAEKSDLIEIIVTHRDPDTAVAVANAWGQEYARQVNMLYSATAGGSYAVVRSQVQTAKTAYEKAQAALEEALAQDRSDELNRRIAEDQATIQALHDARDAVVPTLLSEIGRLERLQGNAEAMRAQVQGGGQAAAESNGPALVLLKAQAFANTWNEAPQARVMGQVEPASTSGSQPSAQTAPVTLQVQAAPLALQVQNTPLTMTAEAMADDLDALVATLESHQSTLKGELRGISESLVKGEEGVFFLSSGPSERGEQGGIVDIDPQLATAIGDLEQRVRALRAQLSREMSRQQEAQAQRDLAWQSYDNLARKEAELAIAAQITGAEVRFAAPAAFAQKSASGRLKTVAVAAVAGLLLGIVVAYALEFWQGYRARTRAPSPSN